LEDRVTEMQDTERCEHCKKPRSICVCDRLPKIETHTRVLVLQHPQEGHEDLGTVPLLERSLPNCVVKVGLSWASLSHALGEDVENARWAVVYPTKVEEGVPEDDVLLLDKKGRARDPGAAIDGIVVLDGSWSQAKSLWWRNAWLLKLGRIVVTPREPSIYGKLRKEPRREFVSTLEAVADVLVTLGEPEEVRSQLRRAMRTMVQRARDVGMKPPTPPRRGRIPLPKK
jgi:DTW domain-containing protein YfiP